MSLPSLRICCDGFQPVHGHMAHYQQKPLILMASLNSFSYTTLQPFICLWCLPVIDPAVGNKLRIREEAFL